MIKVVFLILNYKTYSETIRVCRELLGSITEDYKIVIVDNASPNDSFAVLSDTFNDNPYVDVISSGENGGYAKGNNYGLRYIEKYNPDYVAIMNNDIHIDMSVISRLIFDYSKIKDIGAIAPVQCDVDGEIVLFPNLNCQNFWTSFLDNVLFKSQKHHTYKSNTDDENIERVGIIPGAFVFSDFSILKSVDYYDECTFLYCEESFLSKKLEAVGKYCYIDFGCSYIHEHSLTIDTEAGRKKKRGWLNQGRRIFIKRYSKFPRMGLFAYNCSVVFREMIEELSRIKHVILKK